MSVTTSLLSSTLRSSEQTLGGASCLRGHFQHGGCVSEGLILQLNSALKRHFGKHFSDLDLDLVYMQLKLEDGNTFVEKVANAELT